MYLDVKYMMYLMGIKSYCFHVPYTHSQWLIRYVSLHLTFLSFDLDLIWLGSVSFFIQLGIFFTSDYLPSLLKSHILFLSSFLSCTWPKGKIISSFSWWIYKCVFVTHILVSLYTYLIGVWPWSHYRVIPNTYTRLCYV